MMMDQLIFDLFLSRLLHFCYYKYTPEWSGVQEPQYGPRSRDAPVWAEVKGRPSMGRGQGTPQYGPRSRDAPVWAEVKGRPSMGRGQGTPQYGPRSRDAPVWAEVKGRPGMGRGQGTPRYGPRSRDAPVWAEVKGRPGMGRGPGTPQYGPRSRDAPVWGRGPRTPSKTSTSPHLMSFKCICSDTARVCGDTRSLAMHTTCKSHTKSIDHNQILGTHTRSPSIYMLALCHISSLTRIQ